MISPFDSVCVRRHVHTRSQYAVEKKEAVPR